MQEPPVCVTCQKPLQIGTRLDCGQGHIFCPQHAPPDLVREKICPACKGQFTSSTFHHFEGIGGQALPRLALPPSPPEEGHIESGEKADSEPEPEASESDSEDTPPPSLGGTPPRSSPPRTRQAAAARDQRSIRVSGSADASTPAQQIGVATPPSAGTAATTATHHPLHETAAPAPQTAEPPRRLESTDTAAPSAAASSSAGTPAHQRTGNPGKRPMNASGSTPTPSAPSNSANSAQPQAKRQLTVGGKCARCGRVKCRGGRRCGELYQTRSQEERMQAQTQSNAMGNTAAAAQAQARAREEAQVASRASAAAAAQAREYKQPQPSALRGSSRAVPGGGGGGSSSILGGLSPGGLSPESLELALLKRDQRCRGLLTGLPGTSVATSATASPNVPPPGALPLPPQQPDLPPAASAAAADAPTGAPAAAPEAAAPQPQGPQGIVFRQHDDNDSPADSCSVSDSDDGGSALPIGAAGSSRGGAGGNQAWSDFANAKKQREREQQEQEAQQRQRQQQALLESQRARQQALEQRDAQQRERDAQRAAEREQRGADDATAFDLLEQNNMMAAFENKQAKEASEQNGSAAGAPAAPAPARPPPEPKPAGKDGDGVAADGTDQDKSDESDNPDADISESDLFGDDEDEEMGEREGEEDDGVVYRSAGNDDDEGYMSVATDADAADEEAVSQGLSNFVWQESGPSEWDAAATNEVTEVAAPGENL